MTGCETSSPARAQLGNAQLLVQSFADRRPDREVWPGTTWEWAVLRPENGTFDADTYADNYARQKWFYQAQIESPAMFKRSAGAGSLYWLNTRDSTGAFLDGSSSYVLSVPQPVPNKLFWSITVYDANTRSEILTDQNKAALRSMFELADVPGDVPVELPLRPHTSTRWRGPLDQDHSGVGMVRLLPHLRTRGTGLRWIMAAS